MAVDCAGWRRRAHQTFDCQLSVDRSMTVVLRPEDVASVRDDSHHFVLAFCNILLWLRPGFWRSRRSYRSGDDHCRRTAQLGSAKPPGQMDRDQLAGDDGRCAAVDWPALPDASKSAILADLDGRGAVADRCLPSCDARRAGLCTEKLRRRGNRVGNSVPTVHGLRSCAGPSQSVQTRSALAMHPFGRWHLTGRRSAKAARS